ncbi:hypothetical protein MMASJCM_0441 [Mycobacteroides abscessus subsp. massiliense CCUG 48898 = JCM 15300]|nr:hypothetical protein MMASJCM_0441 [Mycobacteroides abscessus subsp. massiliense CCUG 48898 = JCM 15300]
MQRAASMLIAPFKRARERLTRDIMSDHAYTYHVRWSGQDQMFAGWCTEFPGITCLAPDPHTALQKIIEAVREQGGRSSGTGIESH